MEAAVTNVLPMMIVLFLFSCAAGNVLPVADFARIWGWSSTAGEACSIAFAYGLPLLLFAVDGAAYRATYGMRARQLILRKTGGGNPGFGLSFLRILVGVFLLPLLPISVALQWKQGRTLADLICGTQVCERIAPDPSGTGHVGPAFPVAPTPRSGPELSKGRQP